MTQLPAAARAASLLQPRSALARALRQALGGAALGAVALAAPMAVHAQAADARAYDIPGGPLEDVLGRFGRESGIMLSFTPDVTNGLRSPGLKGSYTVRGGLDTLLGSTGIAATRQPNGSYVLNRAQVSGDTTTLPAVTVATGVVDGLAPAYAGGQLARGGSLGVLGTSDIMDVPFNTTNFTVDTIENLQARSLGDVVVNDSSVRTLTSSGGFGEEFQIRGYSVSAGDVGVNGLYGMASASRMPAAIMERVEVLKGPGTLMNGIGPNGSIGGNINIVTKRAGDDPLTRVTATYASSAQFGGLLDMGRRFGENNEWGIRVNGAYRDGETSIRGSDQSLGLGALALDYRGSRLRWSLDAYDQRERIDEFRPQISFQNDLTHLPKAPSARENFYPGSRLDLRDSAVMSRIEYDVTDALSVFAAAGYRYGKSQQDFPGAAWGQAVDADGNFGVQNAWYDAYSRSKTGDIGLRARFDTFGVKHNLTLSATTLKQEQGYFYATSAGSVPSNLYDPAELPAMSTERGSPSKTSESTLSSLTATDTLSFLDDRILLTGGLRQQRVKTDNFDMSSGSRTSRYNESAISPLAGFVVKPLENVSVYGNFTSGLTTGGTAPEGTLNAGQAFAPYKSKQYEAGVKVDWGKIITTASVFQIDRPSGVIDSEGYYSLDGRQRNRGLELAAFGEVTPGLRMTAGTTFYHARLDRTEGGANDGNRVNSVPDYTFNVGVDWDTPWVRGLSLNARAIHTASVYYNADNTAKLPSWTRYDVGARYATEVAGRAVVFRATVENVFNKNYWLSSGSSYATVAAPRTFLLSAQIDF
ncbi:TonB-dependent receptor [Bordetella genomosp. 1]|uniref:TonB-dependent receptor n=1 Tax=Bordetella genomosp. 1 TaxID=1395607 RepID=UPI0020CFDD40|nr:TonB-dependent receptor [Bordetella genomosp. 1]